MKTAANHSPEDYTDIFQTVKSEIGKVIIGQEEMIDLMIYTLLARGHILLEGVPGLAKSLAVETFSRVVGGEYKRFQFTPDKMPGDITGTTIYNEQTKSFEYHPGPVFCNIFMGDEINRASPKVQSALLQAMQEKKVDADRETHPLPDLFMVLATQNPIEQVGTYPLAEAQTDRFMVRYDVGYPTRNEEAELIQRKNENFEKDKEKIQQITTPGQILRVQHFIHEKINVSSVVMNYILNICIGTRPPATCQDNRYDADFYQFIRLGASPRATEFLLALSKSRAFCHARNFVNFDDVSACAFHVLRHRILLNHTVLSGQITSDKIVGEILKKVSPYTLNPKGFENP